MEPKFFAPLRAERDGLNGLQAERERIDAAAGQYIQEAQVRLGCAGGVFGWSLEKKVFVWQPREEPKPAAATSPPAPAAPVPPAPAVTDQAEKKDEAKPAEPAK